VNNHSKTYKNLKVNYARGSPPILKLFEEDNSSESRDIGIDSWETDAIKEFLDEKLEK